MEKLIKTVRYSKLLEVYKNLLTPTQIEIMEDHFLFDLSYSEIATNRNVSRAAIEDAIKKGMNKLEEFEEKLNLLNKKETIVKIVDEINKYELNDDVKILLETLKRSVE